MQKQPRTHCLVHDRDLDAQLSGQADPQSLKNSLIEQKHRERNKHLLLASVSRTKPCLQKHPATH